VCRTGASLRNTEKMSDPQGTAKEGGRGRLECKKSVPRGTGRQKSSKKRGFGKKVGKDYYREDESQKQLVMGLICNGVKGCRQVHDRGEARARGNKNGHF